MIKYSDFKFPYQYFHLNFEYQPTGYFKSLDWDHLCVNLNSVAHSWRAEVHSLVMMDTHVHILFRIPDAKENFFTADLLEKMHIPDSVENLVEPLRHQAQYLNTYRYIYRNPLVAGLTSTCEDYPYSSLSGLIGRANLRVHVADQVGLIQNPIKILHWLNQKNINLKQSQLKDLRQPNSCSR